MGVFVRSLTCDYIDWSTCPGVDSTFTLNFINGAIKCDFTRADIANRIALLQSGKPQFSGRMNFPDGKEFRTV